MTKKQIPKPKMTGEEYERIVASIYQQFAFPGIAVTRNEIIIRGSGRRRQVDVAVRTDVIGHSIFMMIECKMLGRPVDIDEVDRLIGKMKDVGAQEAVIVSDSGFRQGTLDWARENNIHLVSVIDSSVPELRSKIHVPIRVTLNNVVDKYDMNLRVYGANADRSGHAMVKQVLLNRGVDVVRSFQAWTTTEEFGALPTGAHSRFFVVAEEPCGVQIEFAFRKSVRSFVNDNIFAETVGIYDHSKKKLIQGTVRGTTLEEDEIVRTWREVPANSSSPDKHYERFASFKNFDANDALQNLLKAFDAALPTA